MSWWVVLVAMLLAMLVGGFAASLVLFAYLSKALRW